MIAQLSPEICFWYHNVLCLLLSETHNNLLLENAVKNCADIFVTADFKYHQFFDAENRIIIADIGHYESEQYTMELFSDLLKENFNTFALHLSKINTNPINYL